MISWVEVHNNYNYINNNYAFYKFIKQFSKSENLNDSMKNIF